MGGKPGKNGKVIINDGGGDHAATDITGWSLDSGIDMLDDTPINVANGAKTYQAGLIGWTASADANWNIESDDAMADVQTAHLAGNTVTVELYVDATSYYSGTAYINTLGTALEKAGLVTQSVSFQGTGVLTYNAS